MIKLNKEIKAIHMRQFLDTKFHIFGRYKINLII